MPTWYHRHRNAETFVTAIEDNPDMGLEMVEEEWFGCVVEVDMNSDVGPTAMCGVVDNLRRHGFEETDEQPDEPGVFRFEWDYTNYDD